MICQHRAYECSRVTVNGPSHTILVILNAKDHGKFPEGGHVGRLPNLSLVGGTVSVTGNGDVHGLTRFGIVIVGKCEASSYGHLGTDNTVSTVEIPLLVVEVYGSTLGLAVSVLKSKQLGQDLGDRSTPDEGNTMASV
jgi:hypothetical protein